jgi:hypothetical protein
MSGTQTEQASGQKIGLASSQQIESASGKIVAYSYGITEPVYDALGIQTLSSGQASDCCEITGHMPVERSGYTSYGSSWSYNLNINGRDIFLVDGHQIFTEATCVQFYDPSIDWYTYWGGTPPCTSSLDYKGGYAGPIYLTGFQYLGNGVSESLCATSFIVDGESQFAFYLVYYEDGRVLTKKYQLNGDILTIMGHNLTLGSNQAPILYIATEKTGAN